MTALDLISASLKRLGVLAASEAPSAEDSEDALIVLNALIDQWASERLTIYTITRTTWAIVSGTASYSVALGDSRPVYVSHLAYVDTAQSPDPEYSLGPPLTDDEWALIVQKDLTSTVPQCAYWNPTFPTGTVTLWPVPTSTTLQGAIYTPNPVAQFAALSTAVSLPPGYLRALTTNLACDLAPMFKADVTRELMLAASESKAAIKRPNVRPWLKTPDPALVLGSGGHWNIEIDGSNRGAW